MPAKSRAQQRYFGMLYNKAKNGGISSLSEEDQEKVRKMGLDKLREYAKTKHSNLPDKVAWIEEGDHKMSNYKIAGCDDKVSQEIIDKVIKLGYLSELEHINKEANLELEKDAAIVPALKTMLKGIKPHMKSIGKTVSSGSKGIWDDIAKAFKKTPMAEAAKTSPAPEQIRRATRLGIKPQKIKITPADKGKNPKSLWPTRARWGLGGLATGAAVTGAAKSREGEEPPIRYYR